MSKLETAWHNLPLAQVLKDLNTTKDGLATDEAKRRLTKYGENILAQSTKLTAWRSFFSQFKNALVYVLLVATVISLVFREFVDAYVILAAVMINVIVGFIQEHKANRSLEALSRVVKKEAIVLRNGTEQKIESRFLVAGDVIVLEAGNRVPADARLIAVDDLEVNEATLTGESWPVKKYLHSLPATTVLADRANLVFMGTLIVQGRARAVVIKIGASTEMGQISALIKETGEEKTPLQKQLEVFAKNIVKVIVVIGLGIFIFGIMEGNSWQEMFTLAVAVAVSAMPEGLMISLTMILTVGMQRILKHNGLVRRLISAETLGSTTVICTDKTGTLTEGEMRVAVMITSHHQLDFGSSSWRDIELDKETDMMVKIARLCNNAILEEQVGPLTDWMILGSPTEKALMLFSASYLEKNNNWPDIFVRKEEIPFDSHHKFMLTRHSLNDKEDIIFVKGAPEKILLHSTFYLDGSEIIHLDKNQRDYFNRSWQDLSQRGLRVLAGAYLLVSKNFKALDDFKDIPHDFVMVGVWGLSDPLRLETKDTLRQTLAAGINTVVITGDNKFTAQRIAKDLGMSLDDASVVTGEELLNMTDSDLARRISAIKVYARVTPADKLRIIKAWQSRGEVVSMTGDGVNDAPALKAANIGVAVASGSDIAKETADLVLLDNNFKTIVMAIKEGRVIFANIRRVILYLLSDSLSEVIIVTGGLLFHMPLALLATQMLWINMVSDSLPSLSLSMEPEYEDVMNKRPKKSKSLLDLESRVLILTISGVTGLFSLWLFWYFWQKTGDLTLARTVTFNTLGISTLLYVFSIKSLEHNIFKSKPFRNKYLNWAVFIGVLTQLSAVYVPFLNKALGTVPLGWAEWKVMILVIISVMILIEIVKAIFSWYYKKIKQVS